ncbi:MAG: ATP phosphoribosyltransferase [Bacteroidia bacterium]
MPTEKLRVAVQKSGRLSEKSLLLLEECGISLPNGSQKLLAAASNFPLEVLFLRDDDIPQYVSDGVADAGILGENVVLEKQKEVETVDPLGFAQCRLSLATRREEAYSGPQWFNGRKIATSYPVILTRYLQEQGIKAEIEEISGSVEIAPGIGLADAIFDIVSSGSTLMGNGLVEVETVMRSQAVLVAHPGMSAAKRLLLEKLLFRIRAVKNARKNKYILLNTPNSALDRICQILPGIKSPTILPLAMDGWSSLHSVVHEDEFWAIIDQLKEAGAQGIVVCPIEKMIL